MDWATGDASSCITRQVMRILRLMHSAGISDVVSSKYDNIERRLNINSRPLEVTDLT
mgnify:FL=1